MTMLGSILSAGTAKPGGLFTPVGEGAEAAAGGLGEMFAAAIAAASKPEAGEPGTESGATVAVAPAAVAPAAEADPVLVSELTLAVLGNGGVARGEAQSLPTPEPLPEKRVLALAPEGEAQTPPVGKGGKAAAKAARPVLTPTGFDQPVLTKALGSGSAQPVAAAGDPALLQPGKDSVVAEPAAAKPTRRSSKTAEADAVAGTIAQPAPLVAVAALVVPSAATPPAQAQAAVTQPSALPAETLAVQRKSITAYRSGMAVTPPSATPDGARAGQPAPVALQDRALPVPDNAGLSAIVNAAASPPVTARPLTATAGQSRTVVAIAAEALTDAAPASSPEMPLPPPFATPSPLRATRQAEAPSATMATPAAAPSVAREAGADMPRIEPGEAAAPPPALAAANAVPTVPVAIAPVSDGAARIEASAPAAPQLGAILSDQVIDMGVEGQWIDRLAREITQVADGTGHSRFQLSPPNLGRIQVDLWQGEADGRVHLLTETDEAAMRLREGQSTLQADARLAALSLGQVVIERAAGGNLDAQRDPNAQSNPQPQSQPRGQDAGQTAQQNGQQQGQPQAWGQNAAGSGPSQGQSGNSGGQHGKSGDPRAVLEERGRDADTATAGENRVRYA